MIETIKVVLKNMSDAIPGSLVAAVVSINDGLSIAEDCRREGIDSAAASAYLASIVKSNQNAISLLAGDQLTEDILITTQDYYFIIRCLSDQPFFIFLMTEKGSWLGLARMVMEDYDSQFQQFASFLAENYLE